MKITGGGCKCQHDFSRCVVVVAPPVIPAYLVPASLRCLPGMRREISKSGVLPAGARPFWSLLSFFSPGFLLRESRFTSAGECHVRATFDDRMPPGVRENVGQYTHAAVWRYGIEPYAVAADVYRLPGRISQGGWSWYTGSAAWMYRAWVEEIPGISVRGETMRIPPFIPGSLCALGIRIFAVSSCPLETPLINRNCTASGRCEQDSS